MRYDKINRKIEALVAQLQQVEHERDELANQLESLKGVLDGTMHEVRRFSSELSSATEEVSRSLSLLPPQIEKAKATAQTAIFTSGMLAARLGFTDFELNPESATKQPRFKSGIYKKFEKVNYILDKKARSKKIKIRLDGQSFFEILATQSFELIPFVIIDNAIKYSPNDQDVTINFDEQMHFVHVSIKSIGPQIEHDELTDILEKRVRGRNAEKSGVGGDGLGLYLASQLVGLHGGKLWITSSDHVKFQVGQVNYSEIVVNIEFPKH